MTSTLEAIFRQPLRLLLILLLLPALAIAIAYFLPRTYQTTASLWALHRYEIIGDTGQESDLEATPAQTQSAALSELLHSRSFALTVAKQTQLASTFDANLRANPPALDDALVTEISQQVQVSAQGTNLFVITYTNRDAKIAQQVVQAVVNDFGLQSQTFSIAEGQRLLAADQTQLTKANQNANAATTAEEQYLSRHPDLVGKDPTTDPQYALLNAEAQQAEANLQNIQTAIATLNQEISTQSGGPQSLFRVIDVPTAADRAVSRVKFFLTAGGIGLGTALLVCALYIVLLVRRDRAVYTPSDLQKASLFPVVLELPYLASTAAPLLLKAAYAAAAHAENENDITILPLVNEP